MFYGAKDCRTLGCTFDQPECEHDDDIRCRRCGCRRITTRDREGHLVRRDYTYGSVAKGRTSSVMRKVERDG